MVRRTSSRIAKLGMTNQIKARLAIYKETLKGRERNLKKIQKYKKYGLKNFQTLVAREESGIDKIKKHISNLRVLIEKRYRAGQIYNIR